MQVAVADAHQTTGRRLLAGFAVKSLSSIMRELHHEWVDVIKVRSSQELAPASSKHMILSPNEAAITADASMHAPVQPCPDMVSRCSKAARWLNVRQRRLPLCADNQLALPPEVLGVIQTSN